MTRTKKWANAILGNATRLRVSELKRRATMDWSARSERCDLSRSESRQERGSDPAVMPARRRYVCDNAHIHTASSGLDQRLHGTQTRPEAVSGSAARGVNRSDHKGGAVFFGRKTASYYRPIPRDTTGNADRNSPRKLWLRRSSNVPKPAMKAPIPTTRSSGLCGNRWRLSRMKLR